MKEHLALPWISVKDQPLPEPKGHGDMFLVHLRYGYAILITRWHGRWVTVGTAGTFYPSRHQLKSVTHWLPITPPDKEASK